VYPPNHRLVFDCGMEADFVLSFKAVPWPVAKTNISLSTYKPIDGYATSVGTQSSTRGILRIAACLGVAGLPPDHQSVNVVQLWRSGAPALLDWLRPSYGSRRTLAPPADSLAAHSAEMICVELLSHDELAPSS